MKTPFLAAVVVAVALTVIGGGPAFAQDQPTTTQDPVVTRDPDPVVDTHDPDPVVTKDPDPVVTRPVDTVIPTTTTTTSTPPARSVEPSPTDTPVPTSTSTATSSATTPPPSTSTTTTTPPVGEIKVNVEYNDNDDYSIHVTNYNSTMFIFEGTRYNNTYVWTDADGRTYRARNLTCLDFANQTDAQAAFNLLPDDLWWLDGDGNGIACEYQFGDFTQEDAVKTGVRRGGQVAAYPVGAIETGVR